MSLGSFLKYGAGFGLSGGIIAGAYLNGAAKSAGNSSNDYASDIISPILQMGSVVTVLSGPVVGMVTGGGLYSAKRAIMICNSNPRVKFAAIAITGTVVGAAIADQLGNRE